VTVTVCVCVCVCVCAGACFSLCVRHWDDVLLVTVLKGQNVTGNRKDKGKKDQLIEKISVVLLRTELLQRQHRYSTETRVYTHTHTHTHTHTRTNETKPGRVLPPSAGTESCVATYESSRRMIPSGECSNSLAYFKMALVFHVVVRGTLLLLLLLLSLRLVSSRFGTSSRSSCAWTALWPAAWTASSRWWARPPRASRRSSSSFTSASSTRPRRRRRPSARWCTASPTRPGSRSKVRLHRRGRRRGGVGGRFVFIFNSFSHATSHSRSSLQTRRRCRGPCWSGSLSGFRDAPRPFSTTWVPQTSRETASRLRLKSLNSLYFIYPSITNFKFASEGFIICTHTTSLTFDLTSDIYSSVLLCLTICSNYLYFLFWTLRLWHYMSQYNLI